MGDARPGTVDEARLRRILGKGGLSNVVPGVGRASISSTRNDASSGELADTDTSLRFVLRAFTVPEPIAGVDEGVVVIATSTMDTDGRDAVIILLMTNIDEDGELLSDPVVAADMEATVGPIVGLMIRNGAERSLPVADASIGQDGSVTWPFTLLGDKTIATALRVLSTF